MRERQWRPTALIPVFTLVIVAGVCFARLVAQPAAIIVDGDFRRKLRLKKSLVEQKVQANGQPLPISR